MVNENDNLMDHIITCTDKTIVYVIVCVVHIMESKAANLQRKNKLNPWHAMSPIV